MKKYIALSIALVMAMGMTFTPLIMADDGITSATARLDVQIRIPSKMALSLSKESIYLVANEKGDKVVAKLQSNINWQMMARIIVLDFVDPRILPDVTMSGIYGSDSTGNAMVIRPIVLKSADQTFANGQGPTDFQLKFEAKTLDTGLVGKDQIFLTSIVFTAVPSSIF